jgi:hypothetical protein
MPDVRVIGAIGRHRQARRAAWKGTRDAEYVTEVDRYVELTRGDLLAGPKSTVRYALSPCRAAP